MPKTAVKRPASKAGPQQRSGGLMAEMAKAMQGVNPTILSDAYKETDALGGGFDNWLPPEGRYTVKVLPHPGSKWSPTPYVPSKGGDAVPIFNVQCVIEGTDPGSEGFMDQEFTRALFFRVRETEDDKGKKHKWCPEVGELKAMAKCVLDADGGGELPDDLGSLIVFLFQGGERRYDLTVQDQEYTDKKTGAEKIGKRFYWNALVE